jgi:hypothetical protein
VVEDWQSADFSDQNIFEMCVANCGPGFWIRRTTWGATCARVVGIGQFTGPAPYYGNPSVVMDVYSLKGELKEALALVPAAGTYKTWRMIEPPEWAAKMELRPLAEPAIDVAIHSLNKRCGKTAEALAKSEKVFLSVPFERKDEAKGLGARWSATDKRWWMSASNKDALAKARSLGFLN